MNKSDGTKPGIAPAPDLCWRVYFPLMWISDA